MVAVWEPVALWTLVARREQVVRLMFEKRESRVEEAEKTWQLGPPKDQDPRLVLFMYKVCSRDLSDDLLGGRDWKRNGRLRDHVLGMVGGMRQKQEKGGKETQPRLRHEFPKGNP